MPQSLTVHRCKNCVALEDRIAELEETLRLWTEERDAEATRLQDHFTLSKMMACILYALSKGGVKSREQLCLIGNVPEENDVYNVNSQIKRIRQRMRAVNPDLQIKTIYGGGYMVDGHTLTYLRAIAAGKTTAVS